MLEGASNRIAVALLMGSALLASCTTVKVDTTQEFPGAGPVVYRLETEASQSMYGMVATSTPEACKVAVEVLEAGGNAVDAAVATAFALGVSDPGDSGLGGGTYIVIRFADGRATAIDGSAVVPLRVDWDRLTELQAAKAESGIELAAVPGTLAALEYAASRYGTLPLGELIEPSIDLAKSGYHATPFQEVALRTYFKDILRSHYLKYFMLDNGEEPPSVDTLQCRPVLANTLRRIAIGGAYEFYRGSMADEIEADMAARGGFLSRDDLGLYHIRELSPLYGSYRGAEILAFPPPSMGGAVIQALNILETYPQDFVVQDTVDRYQVFAEAFHIATADHSRPPSEDALVAAREGPEGLLSKEFAAERAALITPGQALVNEEFPPAYEEKDPEGNTTQISIVDHWGNVVSLTQSLGRFFGNKVTTPGLGFPYNSLLEGVSEPRAREAIPTSMSPTIVVKDDEFLLALGSGSSTRIPGIVATVISNVVDRQLDLREAVLAPRVLWGPYKGSTYYAEIFPPITEQQIDELGSYGYEPMTRAKPPARLSNFSRFGSVNAVYFDFTSGAMTGVGDPRRTGAALGARY
jgi:gamma-glutamyltranspeptidase/glutathione hydrolase